MLLCRNIRIALVEPPDLNALSEEAAGIETVAAVSPHRSGGEDLTESSLQEQSEAREVAGCTRKLRGRIGPNCLKLLLSRCHVQELVGSAPNTLPHRYLIGSNA